MSAAQILWNNWDKYDNLDTVYRQGFLKFRVYGFGNEAKTLMDSYHAETTALHSYRTGMLFSDILDLYPSYYQDIDKYAALKVALDHDIGELIVGDICDDGRQEHEDKKHAERVAVEEHYFNYQDKDYIRYKNIHREFEDCNTLLGQTIRLADKLDFIAKLIKFEGQGYNLERGDCFSKGDLKNAREIGIYNAIDICANNLRHKMFEQQFDPRLVQICEQFLTCALASTGRPFFKWWHRRIITE